MVKRYTWSESRRNFDTQFSLACYQSGQMQPTALRKMKMRKTMILTTLGSSSLSVAQAQNFVYLA